MKGGVAMCIAAFVAAHESGSPTPLQLVILSDEENGGDVGARFLAEEHPDAFDGAKHALGEFGGATQWIGGKAFYPIQVAEKQMCWLRAHVRGTGGHGALGVKGGAMRKLGDVLRTLDRKQPPVHIIPLVREWFEGMAAELPRKPAHAAATAARPADGRPRRAMRSARADASSAASSATPSARRSCTAATRSTSSRATSSCSSTAGSCRADARRPDPRAARPRRRRHRVRGRAPRSGTARSRPLLLRDARADHPRARTPAACPCRCCRPASPTRASSPAPGVQTYGFLPLKLPADFEPWPLIHNADERVPVDALAFGVEAITRAIARYAA